MDPGTRTGDEPGSVDEIGEVGEFYAAVFEANSAVKLLIDPSSGVIVDANGAAARFYGYSKAELVGMRVGTINVLPEERIRAELAAAQAQQRSYFRFRHRLASGEVRDVEVHSGPVRWRERDLLFSIVIDVTERYRLEDRLARAQRVSALGRVAGGVAHDFNNLLTVIMSFAEAIESGKRSGEGAREAAGQIVSAARRAGELTQRLLSVSRRQPPSVAAVDLRTLLGDLHGLLAGMVGDGRRLVMAIAPELVAPRVLADPSLLVQVLTNLVMNAAEATAAGGTITVRCAALADSPRPPGGGDPPGPWWMLEVEDDGVGIPPEVVSRLFDEFYTTKDRGSGLGLATVHASVLQLGGHIRVMSRPGQTRFIVYLPPYHGRLAASGTGDQRRLRLLVAEADPRLRGELLDQLAARGHHVVACADGGEACARFAAAPDSYDAVVTHVTLPLVDGPALAHAVRAQRPGLPVVFVSDDGGPVADPDPMITATIRRPASGDALLAALRQTCGAG
ncbi:MAG: PAS domain S-box protein [Kofleriaceae bacterium]|nr:PAS domain S-box protein [Kofleriaceae bacterium]MBP6841435.1 PAS domain S-box protein [Kofleriaceae bacterium]MBP9204213.1 PAS domain S-box protein [Kofleriaceae bacterium]